MVRPASRGAPRPRAAWWPPATRSAARRRSRRWTASSTPTRRRPRTRSRSSRCAARLSIFVLPLLAGPLGLAARRSASGSGAASTTSARSSQPRRTATPTAVAAATVVKLTASRAARSTRAGVALARRRAGAAAAAQGGTDAGDVVRRPCSRCSSSGSSLPSLLRSTGCARRRHPRPHRDGREGGAHGRPRRSRHGGAGARMRRLGGRPLVLGLVSWVLVAGAAYVGTIAVSEPRRAEPSGNRDAVRRAVVRWMRCASSAGDAIATGLRALDHRARGQRCGRLGRDGEPGVAWLPNVAVSTRARVEKVAQELHYRADPAASRLAAGRSRTIAVVVPMSTPGTSPTSSPEPRRCAPRAATTSSCCLRQPRRSRQEVMADGRAARSAGRRNDLRRGRPRRRRGRRSPSAAASGWSRSARRRPPYPSLRIDNVAHRSHRRRAPPRTRPWAHRHPRGARRGPGGLRRARPTASPVPAALSAGRDDASTPSSIASGEFTVEGGHRASSRAARPAQSTDGHLRPLRRDGLRRCHRGARAGPRCSRRRVAHRRG